MVVANPVGANCKALHKAELTTNSLDIYNKKDEKKVSIQTIRLSCCADRYEAGKKYTYVIVYTIGTWPAKQETGNSIYPGYVILYKTDDTLDYSERTPG